MNMEITQKAFSDIADHYDDFIARLIPYYHEQNRVLLELLPYTRSDRFNVLDLGAGTGILSEIIAKSFPLAELTLLDMTEDMLDKSRQRLKPYGNPKQFIHGDFLGADFCGKFDVVVAGLSVHHVSDDDKRLVFKKVFQHLKAGGWFILRDYVRGEDAAQESLFETAWAKRYNFKNAAEEQWFLDHMQHDSPSTLNNHLEWFRENGFIHADSYFRYFGFCVLGGRKPFTNE